MNSNTQNIRFFSFSTFWKECVFSGLRSRMEKCAKKKGMTEILHSGPKLNLYMPNNYHSSEFLVCFFSIFCAIWQILTVAGIIGEKLKYEENRRRVVWQQQRLKSSRPIFSQPKGNASFTWNWRKLGRPLQYIQIGFKVQFTPAYKINRSEKRPIHGNIDSYACKV